MRKPLYEKLINKISKSSSLVLNEKELADFDENDIEEQTVKIAQKHILRDRAKKIIGSRYDYQHRADYTEDYEDNKKKMIAYKAKGSSPSRLANSCESYDKIALRYYIAEEMGWEEAAQAFLDRYVLLYWEKDPLRASSIRYAHDKILGEVDKAKQYKSDFENTDTEQFAPTARDWEKMINYMNKKSNPETLARTCKDSNKIVARYIIAKALGWADAERAFALKAMDQGILNQAQLAAYAARYTTYNIPDEYRELIADIIENDLKGGIAKHANKETDDASHLPMKIIKVLDNDPNIKNYSVRKLSLEESRDFIIHKIHGRLNGAYETKGKQYEVTLVDFNDTERKILFVHTFILSYESWHVIRNLAREKGLWVPHTISETCYELESYLMNWVH